MNVQTNCPNCGAPIQGNKCEYCGTWFGVDQGDPEGDSEGDITFYADNIPVLKVRKEE